MNFIPKLLKFDKTELEEAAARAVKVAKSGATPEDRDDFFYRFGEPL
jgi:hypothetical protein